MQKKSNHKLAREDKERDQSWATKACASVSFEGDECPGCGQTREQHKTRGVQQLNDDGLLVKAPDTIALYSGGWIRPLDPNPDDITIEDIAHALSNQCRFTGHTKSFYSVAEHCVLASSLMGTDVDALDALLHDGSEAYLADLARPIKKAPGLGEVYLEAEAKLEQAIAKKFGTGFPMSDEVKWADNVMLGVEIHTLMHKDFADSFPLELPLDQAPRLHCWAPDVAEIRFMTEFEKLIWVLDR